MLSFLFISATGLLAQSRYTIEGDTLTLDMTVAAPGYEFDGELDGYDGTEVMSYLFDHPEINTLRVTGPGGYGPAGRAISAYLVQHGINTKHSESVLVRVQEYFLEANLANWLTVQNLAFIVLG